MVWLQRRAEDVWKERKINKMSQRLREYRQQSIFLLGLLQRY